MKCEKKTEWIHVRVTKDMKERVLRTRVPVTQFVIEAITSKLAAQEA